VLGWVNFGRLLPPKVGHYCTPIYNEGANRGILVTTSGYGPDAYDFAKDKPISLVDGQALIQMLLKNGRSYRIDLEEARHLERELSHA